MAEPANPALEAFLAAPAGATPANPWGTPEAVAAPEPAAKPETGGGGAKEPPQAAPDADDEGEPPEPGDGEAVVPKSAYLAERGKRQDWKGKAVAAQTERDMLRQQLEEAKRAPAAAAPGAAPAAPAADATPVWRLPDAEIPNPMDDPRGYADALAYNQERRFAVAQFNIRLNGSEERLREALGDEEVDKLVAEFKTWPASARDEILGQRDAFKALHKRVTALRVQKEMGDDPDAWREGERARLRAELEAELRGEQPPPSPQPRRSPAAGQPPSLATTRSAAGRSTPAFTGPPSLDQILAGRPAGRA